MVAGGVGLAPFVTLAAALAARGTRTTLFYGARRAEELYCVDLFERARRHRRARHRRRQRRRAGAHHRAARRRAASNGRSAIPSSCSSAARRR